MKPRLVVRYRAGGYDPSLPAENVRECWDLQRYVRFTRDGDVAEERPVTPAEYGIALQRYEEVAAPASARDYLRGEATRVLTQLGGVEAWAAGALAIPNPTPAQQAAQLRDGIRALAAIAAYGRLLVLYLLGDLDAMAPPPPPPPVEPTPEPPPADPAPETPTV